MKTITFCIKSFVDGLSRKNNLLRRASDNRRRSYTPAEAAHAIETLEARVLLATATGDGGQGGTTRSLALDPGLNLVQFQWENYGIPDEFTIQYQGRRIAGDVGLQSGGHSGRTVVAAKGINSADELTVNVTAPLDGTAWTFTVETAPLTLTVDGNLGDVVTVDLIQLFRDAAGMEWKDVGVDPTSFKLLATTNEKGMVAKIDDWESQLSTEGKFYYVPKVSGKPQMFGVFGPRAEVGLGESDLMITAASDNGAVTIPIKLRIGDGYSTTGNDVVDGAGTTKLDIYRQQQRLAYFGYPGAGGLPLEVDGLTGNDTNHAKRMFNVATAENLPPPGVVNSGYESFKLNINDVNAPAWISMADINGLAWYSARQYGIPATGRLISDAQSDLGVTINSGGSSLITGNAPPSKSHDGGRGFDIDNIPDSFLFATVGYPGVIGGFVKAPGTEQSIVVSDGATYRSGNVNEATDRANGLRARTLANSASQELAMDLDALGLLEYSEPDSSTPRAVLEAFVNSGATRIFYNDPRFIDTEVAGVTVKFSKGHFNHMHFNIASPVVVGVQGASNLRQADTMSLLFPDATPLTSITDLGSLTSARTVTGTVDSIVPEQLYRFVIGDPQTAYEEGNFFDTNRDLSITLEGLANDADVQLVYDLNDNGSIDLDEVLYESPNAGVLSETIFAPQLPSGVYYARIVRRAGDTPFTLTLSLASLPVPTDSAGATVSTAAELGVLNGFVERTDFVGETDTIDLYRFQTVGMTDLRIKLDGLNQGDVSIALGQDTDNDGALEANEVINFVDEEGNADEILNRDFLPAGNYLVKVERTSGNSDYCLQITPAGSLRPIDRAGETIPTAFEFGTLVGEVEASDFVGEIDKVDLYAFTMVGQSGVTVSLGGMSADADLYLLRDADNDGELSEDEVLARSTVGGSGAERIDLNGLAPGAYFVRIGQYDGSTPYDLSLTPHRTVGADLSVTRMSTPLTAELGSQYTYSVQVRNDGPETAINVRLTESLLNGLSLEYVSQPDDTSVQSSSYGFVGHIPSLAAGDTVMFHVTIRSFIAGTMAIDTAVTSDTPDFDESNNSLAGGLAVRTIVSPPADLELSQTVSTPSPNVGESFEIALVVTNRGPGTATVIKVRDVLPQQLAYLSSTADLGSYDPVTGLWTVGNLPPGSSVRLVITVVAAMAGRLTNLAEVWSVGEADPDSIPGNGNPNDDDWAAGTIDVRGGVTEVDIEGPTVAVRAQPLGYTFLPRNYGGSGESFTYFINWGDGQSETVSNVALQAGVRRTHIYSQSGSFSITASIMSSSGEYGPQTTSVVVVGIFGVQPDPFNPGQIAGFIGGSAGSDAVWVDRVSPQGGLRVRMLSGGGVTNRLVTDPISRIVVFGGDGNDYVAVSSLVSTPAWLNGGAGNDTLIAGGGHSLLMGGDGNDQLFAGWGRGILIGGRGSDSLFGGFGEGLLIGGVTDLDSNETALGAILNEWNSPAVYEVRVQHLLGTLGGGLNTTGGMPYLLNTQTVHDDLARDLLFSGFGLNWYFASGGSLAPPVDLIFGRKRREIWTVL